MTFTFYRAFADANEPTGTGAAGQGVVNEKVRALEQKLERATLLNQALWEILRDKAGLTDDDLVKKAQEIDLRDGVKDGKITAQAVRCPKCKRVVNSRHGKCLYCGLEFDKPVMTP